MNILFLTVIKVDSIEDRNVHMDVMREFYRKGHNMYIVSPVERRYKQQTSLVKKDGVTYLNVKTLNYQKTNSVEKGFANIQIEYKLRNAIEKYLKGVKFDAVLYSTPPMTYYKIIRDLKKKYDLFSYLILKDIFPQNAVDLGMIRKNGLIYRYFRAQEKKLYQVSDKIGCTSPATIDYIMANNPEVEQSKLEISPNSIEPLQIPLKKQQAIIRKKYGIPEDVTIFVYGGNLGKPQGLDFLHDILKSNKGKADRFFVIAGSGTEYAKMLDLIQTEKISNALLLSFLPKSEFEELTGNCDVGLIFLDKRFTIPNYPSRLLSYMENKLPVLAATDVHTDIGKIAEDNHYGFWCENGDLEKFNELLDYYVDNKSKITEMGNNGYEFLMKHYTAQRAYDIIMKHFEHV